MKFLGTLPKNRIFSCFWEVSLKTLELTYYTEQGEKITKEIRGFFARLIQHECDHLEGIVFIEKVQGPNGFATNENVNKYKLREKLSNE